MAVHFQSITGQNNADLIRQLKNEKTIKSKVVEEAMLAVDRGNFSKINPYSDSPQPIGYGATISAPHMHAHALELLRDHLVGGETALDIGSGSGYLTVCMAVMVGEAGQVIGIEHIKELVELSISNCEVDKPGFLADERVMFIVGDGREGYAPGAPYNAIHVGAAASEIPEALIEQLKEGGRLVIPVGPEGNYQQLELVDKMRGGEVMRRSLMDVMYVPLTSKEYQLPPTKQPSK